MIKLTRRSVFKTVYDKQNPRKKLLFFDLVQAYQDGLAATVQEEDNDSIDEEEEED